MTSPELERRRDGCWYANELCDAVLGAIDDALLQEQSRPKNAPYIHLKSDTVTEEVFCARDWSRVKKAMAESADPPYARTEEEAKNKLSAWLEKRRMERDEVIPSTETGDAAETLVPKTPPPRDLYFEYSVDGATEFLHRRGYEVTPPPAYQREPPRPSRATSEPYRGHVRASHAQTPFSKPPRLAKRGPDRSRLTTEDAGTDSDDEGANRRRKRLRTLPPRRPRPSRPTAPPSKMKTKKGTVRNTWTREQMAERKLSQRMATLSVGWPGGSC